MDITVGESACSGRMDCRLSRRTPIRAAVRRDRESRQAYRPFVARTLSIFETDVCVALGFSKRMIESLSQYPLIFTRVSANRRAHVESHNHVPPSESGVLSILKRRPIDLRRFVDER